jgi:hypothetical protein
VLKKNLERKIESFGLSLASSAVGLTMIHRIPYRFSKSWRKASKYRETSGHSCMFLGSTRQGKDKAHSRKPYNLLPYLIIPWKLTLAKAGFHLHVFGKFRWIVVMLGAVLVWTAQTVSSGRFLCRAPRVFPWITFRHQRQRVLNAGTSRNKESSAKMLSLVRRARTTSYN